nr:MAG TPA: hypothetical protein [Caudoviricetes sp.]
MVYAYVSCGKASKGENGKTADTGGKDEFAEL